MKTKCTFTHKETGLGSRAWIKPERYLNMSYKELEKELESKSKDELIMDVMKCWDVIEDIFNMTLILKKTKR